MHLYRKLIWYCPSAGLSVPVVILKSHTLHALVKDLCKTSCSAEVAILLLCLEAASKTLLDGTFLQYSLTSMSNPVNNSFNYFCMDVCPSFEATSPGTPLESSFTQPLLKLLTGNGMIHSNAVLILSILPLYFANQALSMTTLPGRP